MKAKSKPNQLYSAPDHKNTHRKSSRPPLSNTAINPYNLNKSLNYAQIIHKEYDSMFGVKRNLFNNHQNIDKNQKGEDQLLEQFKLASLMSFCEKFEKAIQERMREIMEKFLNLEYKIARCQNHFNAIEIELSNKSKEINAIVKQNQWLREANKQIEMHLQELKKKYEKTREKDKTIGIESSVNKLVQKISEFETLQQRSEMQRKQTFRKIEKCIEKLKVPKTQKNNQQNLKFILKDLICSLFHLPEHANSLSISQYAQEKILQNIQLKLRITELQLQSKFNFQTQA